MLHCVHVYYLGRCFYCIWFDIFNRSVYSKVSLSTESKEVICKGTYAIDNFGDRPVKGFKRSGGESERGAKCCQSDIKAKVEAVHFQ